MPSQRYSLVYMDAASDNLANPPLRCLPSVIAGCIWILQATIRHNRHYEAFAGNCSPRGGSEARATCSEYKPGNLHLSRRVQVCRSAVAKGQTQTGQSAPFPTCPSMPQRSRKGPDSNWPICTFPGVSKYASAQSQRARLKLANLHLSRRVQAM